MPMYEYRCSDCGNQFELRQKFSDDPIMFCPKCSGHVEKLISMNSFSLKGSGWYAEGYSNDSKAHKVSPCPKDGACSSCPAAAA